MILKSLLSIGVVGCLVSTASAGDYNMSSSCEMRNGNFQCSSYDSYSSGGRSGGWRRLTKEEIVEIEARAHKWQEFCQPQLRIGEYGVGRYSYAHAGCEFGRFE